MASERATMASKPLCTPNLGAEAHDAAGGAGRALRTARTPPMPEKQLQELVRRTALAFGWLFYHPFDSRKSAPGFPDCTLARDGQLYFIELKTERGQPTEAQWRWLGELSKVPGVRVFVFRPSHWYDGTIEGVLR